MALTHSLRFANLAISALWNRQCVSSVTITFKEPFGVDGRAGCAASVHSSATSL